MHTSDYIANDTKPIPLDTTLEDILTIFKETSFSHLPVVDNQVFCGVITKQSLDFVEDTTQKLRTIKNQLAPFYVTDTLNWFEILQKFVNHNSNIIPVLNKKQQYLGYYELEDFLNIFKRTLFFHEEGIILIISKHIDAYSFSEIAQIVESNKATLYGAFISKIENKIAEITLKLSLHDINNTLHTFRRYDYQILNKIEKDTFLESLNERSNYLQKYLTI